MRALLLLPACMVLMSVGFFALSVFALIGVLRNEFKGNDKIIWFFVVFIPLVGPLLFFTIGKSQILKKDVPLYLDKSVSSERFYRRSSK